VGRAVGSPAGPAVAGVVQDVVAGLAPGELPVVMALGRLDPDAARRRLTRRRRHRDPLGFGAGEFVPLLTPVVWIAVDEVVRRGVDNATTGLRARLRLLLRRPAPAATVRPLTATQLAEVEQRVRELARDAQLPPDQTDVLAERVVARLALVGAGGSRTDRERHPGTAAGPRPPADPEPGAAAG
jgi:hypothetical protein